MHNLPKPAPQLTEPPIRYTSILRAADLQMSLHRINDGPKSNTDSIMRCETDFEMDDLDDGTATVNRYLQQSAPPLPPPTTYLSRRTKPAPKATPTPSRSAVESKHVSDRRANTTVLADHTPVCICQTCEREATEAKAAALLHRQRGTAQRHVDGRQSSLIDRDANDEARSSKVQKGLDRQWSLASLPRLEHGAVGYGYRHQSQGTADIWTNASKQAES